MSWFGIRTHGADDGEFLLAAVARSHACAELDGEETADDSADHGATALFRFAALQLEEMAELVARGAGVSPDELIDASNADPLDAAVREAGLDDDEIWDLTERLDEALELWRALRGDRGAVSHAREFDGSITLTIGPDLPQLPALGVQGSEDGELWDDAESIAMLARVVTELAAQWSVRVERGRWRSVRETAASAQHPASRVAGEPS